MPAKILIVLNRFITEKKLTFFSCILALIVLPFHVSFLPPVMILWALSWIIENRGRFSEIFTFSSPSFLLFLGFLSFFLWYLSGLLYTEDIHNGTLLLFRRLSFIVFPLVLIAPGELIVKNLKLLLRIFFISTLAYIIVAFIVATCRSVSFTNGSFVVNVHPPYRDWDSYFFKTDFAFSQHPTYLAMYVVLSVFIAFDLFFDKTLKHIYRYISLASVLILIGSLYFLSSRAGILTAMILIPVYLIVRFLRMNKSLVSISILVAVLGLLVVLFFTNDRIKYYISDHDSTSIVDKFKADNRVPIWKSAVSVIKRNPVIGVGPGDASLEIRKAYTGAGYSDMYYNNLNAHNQFLETLVANGLIGFLFLSAILVLMIYYAVKKKNMLYGIFIAIIIVFFLFESILNRIAGVTFFALFSFLLLAADEKTGIPATSETNDHSDV